MPIWKRKTYWPVTPHLRRCTDCNVTTSDTRKHDGECRKREKLHDLCEECEMKLEAK